MKERNYPNLVKGNPFFWRLNLRLLKCDFLKCYSSKDYQNKIHWRRHYVFLYLCTTSTIRINKTTSCTLMVRQQILIFYSEALIKFQISNLILMLYFIQREHLLRSTRKYTCWFSWEISKRGLVQLICNYTNIVFRQVKLL